MAIDREGILGGGERVVDQMATPAHFGYIPDVAPIPYDPEAARRIVEAKGEAGQEPMVIKTSPVFDQRIVQALQQMLSGLGFNASIDMLDMATYLADSRQEDRIKRPILGFGRWSCACQDVDGVVVPLLHSTSSWSRVDDPKIDALLAKARGTRHAARWTRISAWTPIARSRPGLKTSAISGRRALGRLGQAGMDADREREPVPEPHDLV